MATEKTSRGHGTGGVYVRPDGRLVARIMVDGRRHAHYVRTKQEGYSWLAKMRRDHELGIAAVTERQTLEQFLAHWLEMVKTAVRAPSYKKYEELVRLHIVPTLGKTQLVKLSPQMVELLYSRKLAEGLGPTSVRTLHTVLHHALKDALRMGLVQRNVVEMVTPPRKPAHEAQVLTAQQLQHFLDTAKSDHLEALYVVALSTGMRSGEILALRWRDVDLEAGALHLKSNLLYLHGEFTIAQTKTKRSRRQVTLTRLAIAALKNHRKRQLEQRLVLGDAWQDNDLVFPRQDGSPMAGSHLLNYQFRPLLRQAGLPEIRFHDLRHSCATLLLSLGIHPSIVASMLGHSTISMTLDVYSHVTPSMQAPATEALDRLFGG